MSSAGGLAGLSRQEKLALLARRARPASRIGRELPLSFAQRRLWFLDRLDPGNHHHDVFRAAVFDGPLDPAVLARALTEVVRRHESLRTTFHARGDEPRQRIEPPREVPLPLVDLSGLPPAAGEREALALAGSEARHAFDLARGPLLRAVLARLGARRHALLLTLHHIAADGWSLGILFGELSALYPAFAAGLASPLAAPALQYADFAVWQRERMAGERLRAELDWWRARIAGLPTVLELPADRRRPAVESFRGALARLALPGPLAGDLRALSREAGATLFMTLLAAFEVLLCRWSGQAEFLLGTTVAGRPRAELEGVIGSFANTLLLPASLPGNPRFRRLLGRVRESTLAVYGHQDLPFDLLVEELQPERRLSHHPLYQAMFALQNQPGEALAIPGLAVGALAVERGLAKLDLTLDLADAAGEVAGCFEYRTDLLEPATVERLAGCFLTLLAGIAADPEGGVGDLPLLTEAERRRLVEGWNPRGYALRPPVPALIAERARRAPAAPAVLFGDAVLTYGELDARALRVARALRRRGVGADGLVGLCVERSPAMAVALLGVLKAGAGYVPLDPAYPRERLALMIADTRMPVLLTAGPAAASLPPLGAEGPEVLDLDALTSALTSDTADAGDAGDREESWEIEPEGIAYVVYTSGSTGRPKGVGVPHRALANHATECAARYRLGPDDRALQFTSLSFDITSEEVFPTWIAGGAVVPRPPGLFPSFDELDEILARHRVTVVNLPTAYWHEWASELHRLERQPPADLRLVVIGTEQALPERLAEWLELTGGRVGFANSYASTECTVTALIHFAGPESLARARRGYRIPVGRPIENCRVYVLDGRLAPVPVGVPGDVYIGGANVSRGYLNQPERTAASFLPDPFAACGPGGRIYRQGDLGRFLPDGELECLGRSDDQVKVRGFRVEPGEVEAVLVRHPAVRECAVLVRDDGAAGRRLIGYVARDPERPLAEEELRAYLREILPEHMVPAGFVVLPSLPLTANGKIDRRALARHEPSSEPSAGAAAAEESPLAGMVARIWEQVLRCEGIGPDDDFFALGGHSLLAVQVVSRLREAFGVEIPLRTFFTEPTVAALAAAIEAARRDAGGLTAPPLTLAPRDGPMPCSFAQQRLWVVDQLAPGGSAYNLPDAVRWRGALDPGRLGAALAEVVRRHEVLRTTFAVRGGEAVQVIGLPAPPALPLVDLSALPAGRAAAEAGARMREDGLRPFHLGRGPLLRATLYRLAAAEHRLLLCLHHIVSDGNSSRVLLRELVELYGAVSRGEPSPLPPLPVQYADFAAWQRAVLSGDLLAAQLAYWRGQLAGAPPAIALPTDRPRPAMETMAGARHHFTLPAGLGRDLAALGRRRGATLFMTLLAGFDALLARWSGQEDVVVGWPIAGRGRPELEGLIGYFANTLAQRARPALTGSFSRLLGEVREMALDAYTHGDLPFERLVEELRPERHLAHNPIFQVFFVLHDPQAASALPAVAPGLEVERLPLAHGTSLLDLSLAVSGRGAALDAFFEYKTALFDPPSLARMAGHLSTFLAAAASAPEEPLGALPILSAGERSQLVVGWNDSAAELPAEAAAHRLFARRAAADPGAVAIEQDGEVVTYGELGARAERLARRLCRRGVGPGELVGICLERSPTLVAALLAVLAAGGAYVPLDPTYPAERLAFLAEDSGLRLLLTESALRGVLPPLDAEVLELDGEETGDEVEDDDLPLPAAGPLDLAYVLYTSGSTGKPKGVEVPHGALANFLLSMARQPGLPAGGRLVAVTTLAFDIAGLEIFLPLAVGARIVLASRAEATDGRRLAALLRGAAAMQATPATWRLLLASGWPGEPGLAALCGGEALPAELARELLPRVAALWNLYGPTETTIWSAVAPVRAVAGPGVPIGRPIANTDLHVLDCGLEPAPIGAVGELYIGGAGVARGYRRRPDLTAASFVPHPFDDAGSRNDLDGALGARLYRTGDLARRLPSGEIELLGRADHQVKVRGYRVELGEIEAALGAHPAVAQAAAAVREVGEGGAQLVAYVVARPGLAHGASAGNLRAALREELPEHMVPSLFVLLPELPLTSNGKVDRRALPIPGLAAGARQAVAPRTPVEERVAAVWREVLGLPALSVDDNFFELGGHSLMATQVISRLEVAYGIELGLPALFKAPTVAGLAEAIVARELERADGALLAELLAGLEGAP